MAVSVYTTDAALQRYLFDQLSATLAGIIGWESGSDPAFRTMVEDTLLVLDAASVATFTTSGAIAQLRAVAKYMLWKAAIQWLVTQYDVTVDGSSFKRSQLISNLQAMLRMAYDEALAAGVPAERLPPAPGSVAMPPASVHAVTHNDPYSRPNTIYGMERES